MGLWKRASGALKDRNSVFVASLARRTTLRNPDIEAAVVKATSHNESHVDYRNAQRVFTWIRMSPAYLRPFAVALSARMEKTRSWAVALKGLMLIHGVFCCKVPSVQKIGRLPFDLSNFKDGHSSPAKMWGYNAFVRAYYAFLDQKSAFLCMDSQGRIKAKEGETIYQLQQEQQKLPPGVQELVRLQKMQGLLDMLLQIKPQAQGMVRFLILEAMDCVIIEIYDTYSRICSGIARVLLRISNSAGNTEAVMALKVLQKATVQGEDLSSYFEFCTSLGIMNATECPKVEKIPEEGIGELERIIGGVSKRTDDNNNDEVIKAMVVSEESQKVNERKKDCKCSLQTVITDKWEVFEDKTAIKEDPFAASLIPVYHQTPSYGTNDHRDLPDLISFL